MCRAFAEAGRALDRPTTWRPPSGTPISCFATCAAAEAPPHVEGGGGEAQGYLEDYALVAAALVDLYEATSTPLARRGSGARPEC